MRRQGYPQNAGVQVVLVVRLFDNLSNMHYLGDLRFTARRSHLYKNIIFLFENECHNRHEILLCLHLYHGDIFYMYNWMNWLFFLTSPFSIDDIEDNSQLRRGIPGGYCVTYSVSSFYTWAVFSKITTKDTPMLATYGSNGMSFVSSKYHIVNVVSMVICSLCSFQWLIIFLVWHRPSTQQTTFISWVLRRL